MSVRRRRIAAGVVTFVATAAASAGQMRPGDTPRGTITGHIALQGRPPGNPVIRMGVDPKCADMNRGRQVIQERAMVTRDGSVANVFVHLDGNFPATPVPPVALLIDQRSCIYIPRVVGMRVGQRLQIRNSDELLHNVHGLSAVNNTFNIAQPKAGMVFEFTPKSPELMLTLGCDVHRWMTTFIAVMPHPYFAVTDAAGNYTIPNVPAGRYTLKTWHEQFGEQSRAVLVTSGGTPVKSNVIYTQTQTP